MHCDGVFSPSLSLDSLSPSFSSLGCHVSRSAGPDCGRARVGERAALWRARLHAITTARGLRQQQLRYRTPGRSPRRTARPAMCRAPAHWPILARWTPIPTRTRPPARYPRRAALCCALDQQRDPAIPSLPRTPKQPGHAHLPQRQLRCRPRMRRRRRRQHQPVARRRTGGPARAAPRRRLSRENRARRHGSQAQAQLRQRVLAREQKIETCNTPRERPRWANNKSDSTYRTNDSINSNIEKRPVMHCWPS